MFKLFDNRDGYHRIFSNTFPSSYPPPWIKHVLKNTQRGGLKFNREEEKISKGGGKNIVSTFPRVDRNSNPKSNRLKAFLSGFDCPYFAKLCATFHRVDGKSSRIDRFRQS